jgi:threonine/homoserine/homoserine lactone efflux protein
MHFLTPVFPIPFFRATVIHVILSLNVTVTNLSLNKGTDAAIVFGAGAILIELIIIRSSLAAVERFNKMKGYHKWFNGLSFLILLFISLFTIIAAIKMKRFDASLPFAALTPFVSGVVLSVLNPLHLPFWTGWNVALQSKGILKPSTSSYIVYLTGISVGTVLAFVLYSIVGGRLIKLVDNKQDIINWIVGLFLLVTALAQLFKSIRQKKLMLEPQNVTSKMTRIIDT